MHHKYANNVMRPVKHVMGQVQHNVYPVLFMP